MDKDLTVITEVPGLIPTQAEEAQLQKPRGKFLPQLKLLQGSSGETKDTANTPGDFFLNGKNLRKKVKIVVCGRRHHAMLFVNNKKTLETYNCFSKIWDIISNTVRSNEQGINPSYGSDWLVWIIDHQEFCTFLCGKSSTLRLSDQLKDYISKPENRKPAARDLPHTVVFELSAYLEDKLWGPNYKAWCPVVEPLPMESETHPTKNQISDTQEMFFAPVETEKNMEEITNETDR